MPKKGKGKGKGKGKKKGKKDKKALPPPVDTGTDDVVDEMSKRFYTIQIVVRTPCSLYLCKHHYIHHPLMYSLRGLYQKESHQASYDHCTVFAGSGRTSVPLSGQV